MVGLFSVYFGNGRFILGGVGCWQTSEWSWAYCGCWIVAVRGGVFLLLVVGSGTVYNNPH